MAKKFFDRDNLFKDAATGRIQKEKIPVTAEDRIAADKPVNRAMGGIMHTVTPEPSLVFDTADNERVLSSGNAYIIFGSDRPGTKASGFGAQGTPSSTIDLVVGRMASANAGEGPRDGMMVNSNFAADSARIYVSQLTDLDTNFGIATGKLGKENPRSGIGIKADHVRIIGREGVKIVSGGMQGVRGYGSKGETNSQGGELESASKIELIAGNNTSKRGVFGGILKPNDGIENLQPVVKGENMERCLEELSEIITDILSSMLNLSIATMQGLGGIGSVIYPLSAITAPVVTMIGNFVTSPVYQTRIKKVNWEFDYLDDNAQRYICSKNVSAT